MARPGALDTEAGDEQATAVAAIDPSAVVPFSKTPAMLLATGGTTPAGNPALGAISTTMAAMPSTDAPADESTLNT